MSCLSAMLDLMHMLSSDTTVNMIYLDFQIYLTRWIMAYCCTSSKIRVSLVILAYGPFSF